MDNEQGSLWQRNRQVRAIAEFEGGARGKRKGKRADFHSWMKKAKTKSRAYRKMIAISN